MTHKIHTILSIINFRELCIVSFIWRLFVSFFLLMPFICCAAVCFVPVRFGLFSFDTLFLDLLAFVVLWEMSSIHFSQTREHYYKLEQYTDQIMCGVAFGSFWTRCALQLEIPFFVTVADSLTHSLGWLSWMDFFALFRCVVEIVPSKWQNENWNRGGWGHFETGGAGRHTQCAICRIIINLNAKNY